MHVSQTPGWGRVIGMEMSVDSLLKVFLVAVGETLETLRVQLSYFFRERGLTRCDDIH